MFTSTNIRRSARLAAWLILASAANLRAGEGVQNWPQFRGPTGQGDAGDSSPATRWSENEGVVWKTEIPGRGWSSPVVDGKEIWLTTAVNEGHSLHAVRIDRSGGKITLDKEVFAVEQLGHKHAKNSFASPTPILAEGRVYVHFGTYGTAALDRATGEILWRDNDLKIEHEVGPGSSPVLYKNLLLMTYDGTDTKFTVALDAATGKLVWKKDRPPITNTEAERQKAFCTPLVINAAGRDQMIATAADQAISQDPMTGEIIWSIKYDGFSCVPRPVYADGLVYLCTGFSTSEVLAVKPDGTGDVTASHIVWRFGKQAPTNPSPVISGGELYIVSDRGIATCLDAKTGAEVWKQRLGGNFTASPILAAGRVYFFNEEGEATIIEAGRAYKEIARNKLDGGFMASPAVVGRTMYLRTETHLYRIEDLTR